jgi:hypothetical protein
MPFCCFQPTRVSIDAFLYSQHPFAIADSDSPKHRPDSQMSEEGGARSRRRTTKVVNYSKEQDFSDAEDVFEDDDEKDDFRAPVIRTTSTKKRGRPRKSIDPADPEMDDEDFGPSKPVFAEKGYDTSLLPLRERFPYLPEVEADGSPRIDMIVGRRPISLVTKVDRDDESDDDDGEEGANRKRRSSKKPSPQKKREATSEVIEYEYLIKYKGVSYLHLEWKTGSDLESMNRSAKNIYRRYLKKLAAGTEEDIENPEIDPSYVLPQKIVDEADQEVSVELTDKELIDWEKENKDEDESDDEDDVKFEIMDEGKDGKEATTKDNEKDKGDLEIGTSILALPTCFALVLN